jgi:hypothetical protein
MEEALMSAAEALRLAQTAGVTLIPDGDALLLQANEQPPQAVLDALTLHKAAILDLLRPGRWTAEHWRTYFDKLVWIAIFRDGAPRPTAEAWAFDYCETEWLKQNPAPSSPGSCAWCGRPEAPSAVVLPFGTEPGTHAWLHSECWPAWYEARRADAIAALKTMAVFRPTPAGARK